VLACRAVTEGRCSEHAPLKDLDGVRQDERDRGAEAPVLCLDRPAPPPEWEPLFKTWLGSEGG